MSNSRWREEERWPIGRSHDDPAFAAADAGFNQALDRLKELAPRGAMREAHPGEAAEVTAARAAAEQARQAWNEALDSWVRRSWAAAEPAVIAFIEANGGSVTVTALCHGVAVATGVGFDSRAIEACPRLRIVPTRSGGRRVEIVGR